MELVSAIVHKGGKRFDPLKKETDRLPPQSPLLSRIVGRHHQPASATEILPLCVTSNVILWKTIIVQGLV